MTEIKLKDIFSTGEEMPTVDLYTLARSLNPTDLMEVLAGYCSALGGGRGASVSAKRLVAEHRTNQASVIRFLADLITEYAIEYEKQWGDLTDLRNEGAVAFAKRIYQMDKDGDVSIPYL